MGLWQIWQRSLTFVSQQSPPQLVEGVMLLLAMILCTVWFFLQQWPYLVLCLSYILGAIASILVRELIAPSSNTHMIRLTAASALVVLVSSVALYVTQTVHPLRL